MTSLRIALVYDCLYPESVGGVEHRNFELARALAARGHQVTLAGFTDRADRADESFEGVEILQLAPRGKLYSTAGKRSTSEAIRFARACAKLDVARFDIVETANIPYVHLFGLARRCRRAKVPLAVTWYEYWGAYWREYLRTPLWPVYAGIERACAPLGTLAMASSRLTAERLAARRGEEIPVIPVGIRLEAIRTAAQEGALTSRSAPLVYAGRLQREKRLDLLFEALVVLATKRESVERPLLDLIGSGPDRERLQTLAHGLGIESLVRFVGYLPTNVDVWRHLGGAKLAVQPSSREGFGLFPLEAMAAGLPVVYCEAPESALDELVLDGKQGVRTAATPEALAEALARLLNDEPERRRLAEGAASRAESYGWDAVAARVAGVFERLTRGTAEI